MDRLKLSLVKPVSTDKYMDNLIVKFIDDYVSVVWTDRFNKAGEIELVVPVTEENLTAFQQGYFILCDRSTKGMIIESIELTKSVNGDQRMTIKGRSAESLLDRRIVMNSVELTNIEIKKNKDPKVIDTLDGVLVKELVGPTMFSAFCDEDDRVIENFGAIWTELPEEGEDPGPFDEYQISTMIKRGANVYDSVVEICNSYAIGFKVDVQLPANDSQQTALQFTLSFYTSTDRSYDQNERSFVAFSPNLDNLKDLKFLETTSQYKNVGLVLGEIKNDNEKRQRYAIVSVGSEEDNTGFNRRETCIDATDIATKGISKSDYDKILQQKGDEYLSTISRQAARIFDGVIILQSQPYTYGTDYVLGDFIQIVDPQYSKSSKVRVEEIVFSDDSNGLDMTMGFTVMSYTRPEDEEDWLKYVYYYKDVRTYNEPSAGINYEEVDVIVITGFKVNEINDDGLTSLPIPIKWKNYYIVVELDHSGG